MNDKNKTFDLQGDKKVKVEEGFAGRIKNFWRNLLKNKKKNNTMNALQRIGAKLTSIFSKKTIEEIREKIIRKNIQKQSSNDEFDSLIKKLKTEKLTEKEINDIVKKCEDIRQITMDGYNEMIKEQMIEGLEEERDEKFEKMTNQITEAKKEAESKIEHQENNAEIEMPIPIVNRPEKTTVMPEIIEEVKPESEENSSPIFEPEENNMPIFEPIEFEKKELPEAEEKDETQALIPEVKKENIDIPKVEEVIEKNITPDEMIISEEAEITDEPKSDKIDLGDLTKFDTYDDYLSAYRQERIDIKDIDRFYQDLRHNNYPSDLLDEKTFAEEKQRLEDEIEYKKLESERAEAEKRLRIIKAKQTELEEKHAELQTRFNDLDSKMSSLRQTNVSLEQKVVDQNAQIKEQEQTISSLQGQLSAAQNVAKKAQAESYEDKRLLSEIEKELTEARKREKELEKKASNSAREAAESRKELESTRKRISEDTEAYLKRLNSVKADDKIEETALKWAEEKIKENQTPKQEKEGPKHFADPKPKHLKEKQEKIDLPVIPSKIEEKKEDEPKVIALSKTPDSNFQGIVTQDSEGKIEFVQSPLEVLKASQKMTNNTVQNQELVDAIKAEAEEKNVDIKPKIR